MSAPQTRAKWHDAYDAQMALWRWYRAGPGRQWLAQSYRENASDLQESTREMLLEMYGQEAGRLIDCDPIFVSAEMCELIDAAKDSFAPEPLRETDLVTTRGFLYYETPFVIPDRFEEPVSIHAASWARIIAVEDPEQHRLIQAAMLELAGQPGFDPRNFEEMTLEDGGEARGIALTLYATRPDDLSDKPVASDVPPVLPMHVTPWYFGMTFEGNEVDENERHTGAEWWWRVVQTTFRLMQQHIAVRHQHRPDRAARRDARKLSFPDDQQVVIVRLRREESERHEPSGEEANYSHRFIVSGHWRNQWYPSIQAHRQIWISPFVKGPEGLPLIVRPRRVFQWER